MAQPSSLGTSPSRSHSEESAAPCFTFNPADEQLVVHYLRAYAAGRSLRWDHVVEAGVYSTEPWSLLGDDREIGYFLTKRTRHGNRVKRTAGRGTWTGQTKKKEIVSIRGEVIGFKAMFSFCIGDDDNCSKKPPKKTTGYVMYEYELPSTADKGTRQQGASQEPVLCCIKKSAREIARSHKRKREEAAHARAAGTNFAANIHGINKRARHPPEISEAGMEYDSSNSIISCIRAAPESATPEYADSATFTDEALALAGIPSCLFAADRSSALPTYLSAAASPEGDAAYAINLVSNSPLEMTMGVDQQQPILYHGDELVTMNADFFEVEESGYYSTIPEYADSVTLTNGALADVGTSSSTCAADNSTAPLPMMAWSFREREMMTDDINPPRHSALGMTADDNLQPIPYHGEWTVMMNADNFDGLGGDMNIGDIVSSTAVEGPGDRQPPPLPYKLIGITTADATADRQLLLPPVQDKHTVADEAGSLDQLLSVLNKAGFSDWYDSLLKAEPSLPPLVDSGMPFRDCRMPPIPLSSDGIASSTVIEGNKRA